MFFRRKKEKKNEKPLAVVIDTNIVLRVGQFRATSILNGLKGQVFVPWSVLEELIAFRKEAIYVKRTLKQFGTEPRFMERMTEREQELRRRRHRSVLNAWPLFSQKIEDCEWRIAGSSSRMYFQASEKPSNGDPERIVGEEIGSSDVRIIAVCKALRDKGFDVILLTRDRDLKRDVESEGFHVEVGLSDLVENGKGEN